MLLLKEFAAKAGLTGLIKKVFKTNDPASFRVHTDSDTLMQAIFQIIASYFQDDCADELTHDPVLTALLDKGSLASQPTLSRFWNRMDEDTLKQFDEINSNTIRKMEQMLFDLAGPL